MSFFIEITLTILYTAIFIALIYKLKFFTINNISRKLLSSIFVLKILCGIILAVIYTYYYKDRSTSDVFKFFDDAKNVIYNLLFTHPLDYLKIVTGIDSDAPNLHLYYDKMQCWYKGFNYNLYNDNRTIIRFNAIVMIFSFGYYHVHTVFISFLSLIGLTAIFKTFYKYFADKKYGLILAVFFAPSVMLWASGVLKEGLIFFAFGLLIYSFNNLLNKNYGFLNFISLLLSVFLLIISKFYILLSIIPSLISLFWVLRTNNKYIFIKFLTVHILFLILAFNSQFFVHNYNFTSILSLKQHDFVNFINSLPKVGSRIYMNELHPTWISILKNSPNALLTTLFRPIIFEANSFLVFIASIENLLILLLLALCMFFINPFKKINNPYFYMSVFFVIFVFTLSGLTTPVFGALVRYKTPALPFLFIIFLFLLNTEKLFLKLHKYNSYKIVILFKKLFMISN